jgi:hypothetical protein
MVGRSAPGVIRHFSHKRDAVVPTSEEGPLKPPAVSPAKGQKSGGIVHAIPLWPDITST